MVCICFSLHLEAFLIVSRPILSTFHDFVAGMLGEAKKRKVHKKKGTFVVTDARCSRHIAR